MLKTSICDLFGIEYPIVQGGMGGVSLAKLAAAVSEAGGLGTIALAGFSPAALHDEIAAARALTAKPIAVNLLVPFLRPEIVAAVAQEPVAAVTLFWGDPAEQIPPCKALGLKVIWQCGSAEEALAAKRAGADAIIAQGFEAGGHVRGTVTTLALVPEVRDAIGDLPLLAAGGFSDGRGLVAALALGADGAVFGTRFLASPECAAHSDYKRRLLSAQASETVYTKLFDIGWPDAAHRVIRTPFVAAWEKAGQPPTGQRPGEGLATARMRRGDAQGNLVNYAVNTPSEDLEGDIGGLPFYAGQSVSQVREILPAAEIVRQIVAEARHAIEFRLASILRR